MFEEKFKSICAVSLPHPGMTICMASSSDNAVHVSGKQTLADIRHGT